MSIDLRFLIKRNDFTLDIDLSLPASGVTAFFGPSGCGKTTLLRAIAGLERSDNGYLKVGDSVWQNAQQFLVTHKRPIGYVFQEPSLFSHLSVERNIAYGLKRLKKAQKLSLDHAVSLLDISHLLARRPDQLSGGEQQRVAIARALAVSPAMLLLDEPLAALDAARKREVLPYLESLHRELDIPIFYVSHSRDEVARLADHLVLLDAGRVQARGSVSALFSRLDLPLAHAADTESVIEAVVAGHDEAYGLTHLDFSGGRFIVARYPLPLGSIVRLQILARDVSITLVRQSETSILNIFTAIVEQLEAEGESHMLLRLDLAGSPLLVRITRKSAQQLQLAPGKQVYAQIKSVALME